MKKNIVPSKNVLEKRVNSKEYIIKKCKYFPCHDAVESCNLCYCVFYPCEDPKLGFYKNIKKGKKVWSCLFCTWNHKVEILKKIKLFFLDKNVWELSPEERYKKFIKEMGKK